MTVNMGQYNGSLTREQFLFHEMRTTAKLMCEGLSDDEVVKSIVSDNLFQFPTERMIENLAKVCVRRLNVLDDKQLVDSIANDTIIPLEMVYIPVAKEE